MLTQLVNLGHMNMGVHCIISLNYKFEFLKVGGNMGSTYLCIYFYIRKYMTINYGRMHKKHTTIRELGDRKRIE